MNIAVAPPTQGRQVPIGVHLGVLAATHASRHYVMAVKSPVRATDFTHLRHTLSASRDIQGPMQLHINYTLSIEYKWSSVKYPVAPYSPRKFAREFAHSV